MTALESLNSLIIIRDRLIALTKKPPAKSATAKFIINQIAIHDYPYPQHNMIQHRP